MNDLEIAKHTLSKKELTLAIVKNGEVLFETRSHRISGFLGAIEQFGDKLGRRFARRPSSWKSHRALVRLREDKRGLR